MEDRVEDRMLQPPLPRRLQQLKAETVLLRPPSVADQAAAAGLRPVGTPQWWS